MWNWALAEWNRPYAAGQRPNARALKKQLNAVKYEQFPWLRDMHRDAHAQPFADLANAWQRDWKALQQERERVAAGARPSPLRWDRPTFQKKGRTRDSFYIANDKFHVVGRRVNLPKIGWVALRAPLRFPGQILGARITRQADQWFLSIQVAVPDPVYYRHRQGDDSEGIDVGVKTCVTSSQGDKIAGPNVHAALCAA